MSSLPTVDYQTKELPGKVRVTGISLFALGLIIVVLGYIIDPARSAFNNIILFTFLTSIGLGSMFIVAIEYLAGAVWSTPFRRIVEIFAAVLIILPIIALPLLLNVHSVFEWTHTEAVQNDEILSGKAPYLNVTFFVIRVLAFAAIWLFFYWRIVGNSRKQDTTKDQSLTAKNIRLSAIFMPFFAFTLTLTAIDWLMSLEPHWFSTIFGVYYFSGTVLSGLAIATFAVVMLNENGYFIKGLTKDHYYSFGALLFAFTNFWAYIAFSQYLLIWYANLPEETIWFLHRWQGSWVAFSIGLIFVRFVIPYVLLLSQPSKMNPKRLLIASVWILFAEFYDLYWIVMPTFSKEGFTFGWIEFGYPVLAVGILILLFTFMAKRVNLVPVGDPKLKRGLDFRL